MSGLSINKAATGTTAYFNFDSIYDSNDSDAVFQKKLGLELKAIKDAEGFDGLYDKLGITKAQWKAWTENSDYDNDGKQLGQKWAALLTS